MFPFFCRRQICSETVTLGGLWLNGWMTRECSDSHVITRNYLYCNEIMQKGQAFLIFTLHYFFILPQYTNYANFLLLSTCRLTADFRKFQISIDYFISSDKIEEHWKHSSAGMSVRLTRERSWVRAPLLPLWKALYLRGYCSMSRRNKAFSLI